MTSSYFWLSIMKSLWAEIKVLWFSAMLAHRYQRRFGDGRLKAVSCRLRCATLERAELPTT